MFQENPNWSKLGINVKLQFLNLFWSISINILYIFVHNLSKRNVKIQSNIMILEVLLYGVIKFGIISIS